MSNLDELSNCIERIRALEQAKGIIARVSIIHLVSVPSPPELEGVAQAIVELIAFAKPLGYTGRNASWQMVMDHLKLGLNERADSPLNRLFSAYWTQLIQRLESIDASSKKSQLAAIVRAQTDFSAPYLACSIDNGWVKPGELEAGHARKVMEDFHGGHPALHWFTVIRLGSAYAPEIHKAEIDDGLEWYQTELEEVADRIDGPILPMVEVPTPQSGLLPLVGATRHPKIVSRVFGSARRYFTSTIGYQHYDGSWRIRESSDDAVGGAYLTALFATGLAVFGNREDEIVSDSILKATQWLAAVQKSDGGWKLRENSKETDAYCTGVVLDCLQRVVLEHFSDKTSRGRQFLINQQRPDGLWNLKGRDQDALSVVILESLCEALPIIPELKGLYSTSRDLFFRAERLARSGQVADRQLAIIALHMCAEMFVYAQLRSFDPPVSYLQDNGRTVGLREGLGLLEEARHNAGVLASDASLPHRTQLRELAVTRDAVVHKGAQPGPTELNDYASTTRKFLAENFVGFLA